jgi:YjbE family integral membrane protein
MPDQGQKMDIVSIEFLWALVAIIMIDVVLGGENALVIAMAAKQLPEDLRKRAMLWGTLGAVATRFVCVAALTYLLLIPGLRLVGGIALIFIAWRLTSSSHDHDQVKSATTFWGAMGTIIMADAVMGLDNALAIAGAAGGSWLLIIIGLLVSVPIILFGSTLVGRIMERYPDSVFAGAFVLYVVAIKMIMTEPFVKAHVDPMHDLGEFALPWVGGLVLTAKQYYRTRVARSA